MHRISVVSALLLTGCVNFSPDGGMSLVSDVVHREIGRYPVAVRTAADAIEARAEMEWLLKRTVTADAAVAIALLNNSGLQASYNELGIAEAKAIAASLPPNPRFSISAIGGSAELEIERKIVADILALSTLPVRREIAADRFRQAQLRAARETLRLAAETRIAYYRAVAARELTRLLTQAQSTAQSTAQVARQLGQTGALSKLDQAREQAFYAETTATLATARQSESSDREGLIRLLGLWGRDVNFRLPDALPSIPHKARTLPSVEADAVRRRLDLQIARLELAALAKSYGLMNATRFISLLEVGPDIKTTKNKETGETVHQAGAEIEFQIPIFDFGEARLREAEQTYMQAVNRLKEAAVNARSEARDAYRTYRSTYDIARHYEREILPLRKIIADETQLQYGAMQIDVFALLAESRQRIAANQAAIDAKRSFWLADASLRTAISGGGARSRNENKARATSTPAGPAEAH